MKYFLPCCAFSLLFICCSKQAPTLEELAGSWYSAKGCQNASVFNIKDSTVYYTGSSDSLRARIQGDSLHIGNRSFRFSLLGDTLRLSEGKDTWDYVRDSCGTSLPPVSEIATDEKLEGSWFFKCQASKYFNVVDGEFLYPFEDGYEMLMTESFDAPLRGPVRIEGNSMELGGHRFTYFLRGDTLQLTPDADHRWPEQEYPLLFTRHTCANPRPVPEHCGRKDADPCRADILGNVNRYTYPEYVVYTYAHGDDNGDDILVKDRKKNQTVYHTSDDGVSFAGMAGPVLLQDNGTGNVRTVRAYNMQTQTETSWNAYGGIDSIKDRRLYFPMPLESVPTEPVPCPQAKQWADNTGWVELKQVDLSSLEASASGAVRCVYME